MLAFLIALSLILLMAFETGDYPELVIKKVLRVITNDNSKAMVIWDH